MKRLLCTALLLVLLWPALAQAQKVSHSTALGNWGTKPTTTCTAVSGSNPSQDTFSDTLTGNTTYVLPTNATGCIGNDLIELWITQATNASDTVTVTPGTGNLLTFSSIPSAPVTASTTAGVQGLLQIPPSTGGATNVTLHQIWTRSSILAQWDLVLQETNPAPLNAEQSVCVYPGATGDVKFNNAIAAVPNGGIVNARCLGFSTQTMAAEVLAPSAIPFTLLIDRATTFNATINNAAKSVFHLQGQGALEGEGEGGAAGGFGVTLANGASVLTEVYLDNTVGANGALKNISLNGNANATVAKGLLYANGAANLVRVTGVQTTGNGSPLMFNLLDITGPMILDNDYADCGSVGTACTPLRLSNDNGGVGTNQVTILNGVYAHEGSGAPNAEIDIADAGGNNTGIIIDGPTLESAHTTAIGINSVRCASCQFRAVGCSAAGANGTTCIAISGVSNNVTVSNETMYNSWTNTLTNTAQGNAITKTDAATPAILSYEWQGFTTNGMWEVTASNNARMLFDNGGLIVNGVPIGSTKGAGISGGGALSTGSNSFAGRITGLAATGNVLSPGFTCPNAVTCAFEDDTTLGGVKVTAQGTTTITFSATNADTADYICSCR